MYMSKKLVYLFGSKQEEDVRQELRRMVLNDSYNTTSSYTPNSIEYPDGLIPFVDRHMRYLHANPKLDVWMYLANLRLMTRTKSK